MNDTPNSSVVDIETRVQEAVKEINEESAVSLKHASIYNSIKQVGDHALYDIDQLITDLRKEFEERIKDLEIFKKEIQEWSTAYADQTKDFLERMDKFIIERKRPDVSLSRSVDDLPPPEFLRKQDRHGKKP